MDAAITVQLNFPAWSRPASQHRWNERTAMTRHEEVVKELERIARQDTTIGHSYIERVADWHLAEVKRMQEEIEILKEKAWKYDQLCK